MSKKKGHSRREFLEGTLAAGAAFAFTGLFSGKAKGSVPPEFTTPLNTYYILEPDNSICGWVGFSPLNGRPAFIAGDEIDRLGLFFNDPIPGEPGRIELLWEPQVDSYIVNGFAWSPDGSEIACIVRGLNVSANTRRISVYIVDLSTRTAREAVVIEERVNGAVTQSTNVSYKKGIAWWNDSYVCVPADPGQGGGVRKFETHNGQSEVLIAGESSTVISSIALTASGELRFIKVTNPGQQGSQQIVLCGLSQNGTIQNYANLTQQLGQIYSARLGEGGRFLFVDKDTFSANAVKLIYKIENLSVVGQIPCMVNAQSNMYAYTPLTVRNDNELVLSELIKRALDGGGSGAPQIKVKGWQIPL
jgi:hypothetical protein